MTRPDIGAFTVGALYRHDDTDELVEFVGVATMAELAGEDVGVFRFVPGGGCLVATARSYARGETFTPAGMARPRSWTRSAPDVHQVRAAET